jgi:hypothetical protein
MRKNYTVYVYKQDRRYRSGERAVSTTVFENRTEEEMRTVGEGLYILFPATRGYRFEYHATMKTVKSLMTGKEVEIDRDTPHCCDPSSETFWSM